MKIIKIDNNHKNFQRFLFDEKDVFVDITIHNYQKKKIILRAEHLLTGIKVSVSVLAE
jgi:predicted HTH domain antitoxin